MRRIVCVAPLFAVILATYGCQSSADHTAARRAFSPVAIAAVSTRPAPSSGSVGTMFTGEAKPVAVSPANQGIAVYTAPKIVQSVLAPYEDEKGRLFGPQVMYEKVEEGRFNPNALDRPELAYIPQENLVVPPGMGNPVASVAMQKKAEESPRLPVDEIDPRDVIATGLLARDDNREEAKRMAEAAGRRPVFDPDLGWILVPPSVVR